MSPRHELLADADRETWVLFALAADAPLVRSSGLEADDFTDPTTRAGFALLAERAETDRPIAGRVEFLDAVIEHPDAENMLGLATRSEDSHVWRSSPQQFDHHVRALKAATYRRAAISEADRIEQATSGDIELLDEVLDTGRAELAGLRGRLDREPERVPPSKLYADGRSITRVQLGWPELDRLLGGGVPRGDVLTLIGCASAGKTTFALETIRQALHLHQDQAVVFASLEMPKAQVYERHFLSFCRVSRPDLEACLAGEAKWPHGQTPEDFDRLARNYFVWNRSRSLHEIAARAASVRTPINLLVVDYVQLVAAKGAEGEYQQVTEVVRGLKRLAHDLNCAVLALSQVSRGVESPAQCPNIRQGRGSGAIEEAADFLLAAFRPNHEQDVLNRENRVDFRVSVKKNRHGRLATLAYRFDLVRQTMTEVSGRELPDAA